VVPSSNQLRRNKWHRARDHRRLETTGLIAIAILILALTVLRYWHNINWSAR